MKNIITKHLISGIFKLYFIPILAAGVFLLSPAAQATPLGLILQPAPDIMSGWIGVTYDATTQEFVASGIPFEFEYDSGVSPALITGSGGFGSYLINATIDNSGNASSGELTIEGYVPDLDLGFEQSGLLLQGDLFAFGYPEPADGGDTLEFLFNVTDGDLASYYLPNMAAVMLTFTGFNYTFTEDFQNDGWEGVSNAGTAVPVPEPATLTLILLGGAGLCAVRRLRARNS